MAATNIFSISDILTIPNGGGAKDRDGRMHSSACMWISIQQYLRVFRNINIDVGALKTRAGLSTSENTGEFDIELSHHSRGLQKLATEYDICIDIYIYDRVGEILIGNAHPKQGSCPGDPNVKIISYGRHFELFIFKSEIARIPEQYKKLFKPYKRKVVDITGYYTPIQIQNMSEEEQLATVLALSHRDHASITDSDPGGGAGKDDDPDLIRALQESRETHSRKQPIQPVRHEVDVGGDDELRKALENSIHDHQEDVQLQRIMEESKQTAKNHFLKLSEKYSDLQNIIDNYNFNIKNTESGYKIEDHELYMTIVGDLTRKLRELKTEQKEILHNMQALQKDIYELLGGGNLRSDDYNRRKYLKYKNKYLQLKNNSMTLLHH